MPNCQGKQGSVALLRVLPAANGSQRRALLRVQWQLGALDIVRQLAAFLVPESAVVRWVRDVSPGCSMRDAAMFGWKALSGVWDSCSETVEPLQSLPA